MRGRLRFPGGGGGSRDVVKFAFGGGVRGSESADNEVLMEDGVVKFSDVPPGAGDADLLSSGVFVSITSSLVVASSSSS